MDRIDALAFLAVGAQVSALDPDLEVAPGSPGLVVDAPSLVGVGGELQRKDARVAGQSFPSRRDGVLTRISHQKGWGLRLVVYVIESTNYSSCKGEPMATDCILAQLEFQTQGSRRFQGRPTQGSAALLREADQAPGRSPSALVAVPHGAMVETERGFTVHSLYPKQLDRFRLSPAGAKDGDTKVLRCGSASPGDSTRRGLDANRRGQPSDFDRRSASSCGATTRSFSSWPAISQKNGSLWKIASTPTKAHRVRRETVERLLKRLRSASEAQRQLRKPAVAAGTPRCRPCRERRRSC